MEGREAQVTKKILTERRSGMSRMENLNSAIVPTKSQVLFAIGRMGGDLEKIFHSIPIYLVNPTLMDLLSPPERRKFLSPKKASRVFRKHCERIWERIPPFVEEELEPFCDNFCETLNDLLDSIWADLEDCTEILPEPETTPDSLEAPQADTSDTPNLPSQIKPNIPPTKHSIFVSMGMYISDISRVIGLLERYNNRLFAKSGPAIFICPERVDNEAKRLKNSFPSLSNGWLFQFVFAYILIHELAHAFTDGGIPSRNRGERLIEDSIANAFAFLRLTRQRSETLDRETALFLRLTANQPLEYQSWEFFAEPGYIILRSTAKAWKARSVPFEQVLLFFNTVVPSTGLFNLFPIFPLSPWLLTNWLLTYPSSHSKAFHHFLYYLRDLYHELPHPWDKIGEVWYRILRDIYYERIDLKNKKGTNIFNTLLRRLLKSSNGIFWSLLGLLLIFTSLERRSLLYLAHRQFR